MEKKVTTVCGDISPDELGMTSLHEHTFLDLRIAGQFMRNYFKNVPEAMLDFRPENYGFLKSGVYLVSEDCAVVDDMDFLVKEYGFFMAAGGQTICDCSPCGGRGDVRKIKELSERAGIHIICATGIYTMTSRPSELLGKDEDFYYQYFAREVRNGIDGTGIRPGILKAAIATMDANGIMDGELAGVRACARLSAETGLSVHIHTDPNIPGDLVVTTARMAIDCGAEPDKVHICHMDNRLEASVRIDDYVTKADVARNVDLTTHRRLLDMGVTIGFDTFGMPLTNDHFFVTEDIDRIKGLVQLISEGYEDQITVGCDFSSKLLGRTYGGYGCARTLEYAIPMLKRFGKESAVEKIFIKNPARILAY